MTKPSAWLRSNSPYTVAAALALLGTACGQGLTSPSAYPTPVPSNAVLTVSKFTAREVVSTITPYLGYEVKLVLAETGGRSGANVVAPEFRTEEGESLGCPDTASRIEAGGSWELDTRDHCELIPYFGANRLSLSVSFTDDQGHYGFLTSTVEVTR